MNPAPEDALQRLAEIAPTLKEAELRVLIELVNRALSVPSRAVRASSRELANATKTARSKVQPALDALTERGLITTRQGMPTRAAVHQINLLLTVRMSGPVTGPPPLAGGPRKGPPQDSTWPPKGATLALFGDHSGPLEGPPPTENTPLAPDPAALDISIGTTDVIDRMLRATTKNTPDPDLIPMARQWLHGYMVKLGREKDRHPPDDRLVAQFLSIAPWPQLERLLYDLLAEHREPGYQYAWFVTVALQRIHGIQPKQLQQRRAMLKLIKPAAEQAAKEGQEWAQLLIGQVASNKTLK